MLILIIACCCFGLVGSAQRLACGRFLPKFYDPATADCKEGKVIQKDISLLPINELKGPAPTRCTIDAEETSKEGNKAVNREDDSIQNLDTIAHPTHDLLDCILPRKSVGHRCCGGSDTYNPEFDTCCFRNNKDAHVHRSKPEKRYACCNGSRDDDLTTVYSRGSRNIPCLHPSLNDKLFRAKRKLRLLSKHCGVYKFAYVIRIGNTYSKRREMFSECYNATILRWPWDNSSDTETYTKCIPIDKYTPKLKSKHRTFLVLSNHNARLDLDFYLDRSLDREDVVFRGPKRKFNKSFRKMHRKCQKKLNRKLSRPTNRHLL